MSEEDFNNPDWYRGYQYGLYRGYGFGIEDFKAGLRAVWKKDKDGIYRIVEKHYQTDKDEAEMSGVKAGGTPVKPDLVLSPDQVGKLNATINRYLTEYSKKHPGVAGTFQPQAYLMTPGTHTYNWGIIERTKLLITRSIVAMSDFIPKEEIMFFVDYEP